MSTATLTRSGKVEIPADILARHGLRPGARLEVVDEGSSIRLIVANERPASDPQAGYGMFKAKPRTVGDNGPCILSEFDLAGCSAGFGGRSIADRLAMPAQSQQMDFDPPTLLDLPRPADVSAD